MNGKAEMAGTAGYHRSRVRHHEEAAAACARLMGSARDAAASAAIANRMREHREQAKLHATAAVQSESASPDLG